MACDPDTAALLAQFKDLGSDFDPDVRTLDIASARAANRTMLAAFAGEDDAECSVELIELPGPVGTVRGRLYTPQGAAADGGLRPLILFFHGGGWAAGSPQAYEPLVKALCAASGALFLSVGYRLAPEHKFPAGFEDGLAAVRWAAEEAKTIGADPERLAVMGDSAGGNLAAAIAHRLHTKGPIKLAAQFLLYPILDVASPHDVYPSRRRFGDGSYLLSCQDIEVTTAWYLDETTRADNPAVSPLLVEDLSVFPPTIILTAGFDPLLDEAKRYAERLRAAGVPIEIKCFERTIHAFLSFGVLKVAQEGRVWLANQVSNLGHRKT